MGIDIGSIIMVGERFHRIAGSDKISDEEFEGLLDDGELDRMSPYYDADREACCFGIIVEQTNTFRAKEIDLDDFKVKVEQAKKEFKDLTGIDGVVLFGADVY